MKQLGSDLRLHVEGPLFILSRVDDMISLIPAGCK